MHRFVADRESSVSPSRASSEPALASTYASMALIGDQPAGQMRVLATDWQLETVEPGPWQRKVLPITYDVGVAVPGMREFVGGSMVVIESAPKGVVMPLSVVLACAIVGFDGKWVIRTLKACDVVAICNELDAKPLTEARIAESCAVGMDTIAMGPLSIPDEGPRRV